VNAVCELQCVRCGNGRGEKRQVKSDLFLTLQDETETASMQRERPAAKSIERRQNWVQGMFPFDSPSKTGLTSGVLGVRLPYMGGRDQGWCTWFELKFETYDKK
jgi:hypothetical protein